MGQKSFLIITNHSYMLWQFRRELIGALLELGSVTISTPFVGREADFAAMGCRMVETPLDRRDVNPARDLALLRFYRRLIRREKPDLVITYSIKPNIYAGAVCRRLRVPCCANVQGLGTAFERRGLARLVTVMYRHALRRARTVFFENESNALEFFRRGVADPARSITLPGAGVNLDRYAPQPRPDGGGAAADTDTDAPVRFLYLGRVMREKGMDEFIEAARRLRRTHGGRVRIEIVGFFEDDYRAAVAALVGDGIAVFRGFRPDAAPFYAACDCVVLPSWHEGMSNVLLEAAASGRAVITTDIPGCREAVEHGVTGWLVPPRSADELYRAMAAFAGLTPAQRAGMGAAGRRKMEREFDRRVVVSRVLDALGLTESAP